MGKGIAFLVLIIFTVAAGGCGSKKKHVLITLELDRTASSSPASSALDERILEVLRKRMASITGREGKVRSLGSGRYTVEVPVDSDLNKLQETLTENAKLEWYYARSVTTGKGEVRPYDVGPQIQYRGGPAYTFYKKVDIRSQTRPGSSDYREMIASWGQPVLTSEDLEMAEAAPNGDGYIPELKFTPAGGRKLETWSRAHLNKGPQLAAVLDGVVVSIAPLRDGTILRDNAVIQGAFDKDYVMKLKQLLNSGALPAPLRVLNVEKL